MRVAIERDRCISCGACWSACPEFFTENPEDTLSCVVEQYRVDGKLEQGEAPPDLEDCVKGAAEECPVQIIQVE